MNYLIIKMYMTILKMINKVRFQMKNMFTLIVIMFALNCYSQNGIVVTDTPIDQSINNAKVVKYPERYLIDQIENFEDVKNTSPENLLASYFSAQNKKWFDHNLKIKQSLPYHNFEDVSKNKYSVRPLIKLSFIANGIENCLVKFEIENDNQTIGSYCIHLEKKDAYWFVSNAEICSNLSLFFLTIDAKYIYPAIMASRSDNEVYNELLEKSKVNGRLNFNSLMQGIRNLYTINNNEYNKIRDPYIKW